MSKIEEAREILKELQVPAKQQADLCCYFLTLRRLRSFPKHLLGKQRFGLQICRIT